MGVGRFFPAIHSFLRQIGRIQVENSRQNYIEYCLERLQTTFSSTARIKSVLSETRNSSQRDDEIATLVYYENSLDELLLIFSEIHNYLDGCLDDVLSDSSYRSPTLQTGQRGRPRFGVSVEQLEYLASLSFSWSKIAKMLGISRMTLYRRRVQFGMLQRGRTVRDGELLVLLRDMRAEFPHMGEVMVLGRLRAFGYSVRRDRVRMAIRRTDPINTALRATTGPLARRVYSVPGPNSLWHMGMLILAKYSIAELYLPSMLSNLLRIRILYWQTCWE